VVDGWANYEIHLEISWHFVASMHMCRAIGVSLPLLSCVLHGDPLLGVVVQPYKPGSSIELTFNGMVSTLTISRYTYCGRTP